MNKFYRANKDLALWNNIGYVTIFKIGDIGLLYAKEKLNCDEFKFIFLTKSGSSFYCILSSKEFDKYFKEI